MSSSKQVAVCTLSLASNASAEANVRLSMPWCANSRTTLFRRPALSSTTITTFGCAIISVSSPLGVYAPQGDQPTVDLDQWNLVRHQHTTNGSSPVGLGGNAGWCGLCTCTSVDGTFETCSAMLRMSIHWGRPEVAVDRPNRR